MRYAQKQLALNLGIATGMFELGRSIPTVKKVTGLSLRTMAKHRLIYEPTVPDPKGYYHPLTGERTGHNGNMVRTDWWRPSFGNKIFYACERGDKPYISPRRQAERFKRRQHAS